MATNYTVKPNQSLPDVIVQATGSMEAGMQFCRYNGVAISEVPVVGTTYIVSDTSLDISRKNGGTEVLSYLQQNNIVIGTLDPPPPLHMRLVLVPKLGVMLNSPASPTAHPYQYGLGSVVTDGFVHAYTLLDDFLTANPVYIVADHDYPPGALIPQNEWLVTAMTSEAVVWLLEWVDDGTNQVVWTDVEADIPTVTFKDVNGNVASFSPVVILDGTIQRCVDCMVADIAVEVIESTPDVCKVRIIRSHNAISEMVINITGMSWIRSNFIYGPDPDDPLNADKIVAELPVGSYTIGVKTNYSWMSSAFPASAMSIAFEIYEVD